MLQFFLCSFLLLFSCNGLSCISNFSKSNQLFKDSLKRKNIYEPDVFVILFDRTPILIGALTNYGNLKRINIVVEKLFSKICKKNKPKNLLIYKDSGFCENKLENRRILLFVKNFLLKDKMIHVNEYNILVFFKTVWIVGYASSCYEKEEVIKRLRLLKTKRKINEFYCVIRYKKNKKKGFVYRHNTY